jgi:predicted TIM-barrel fold metal-dependent hydrolase
VELSTYWVPEGIKDLAELYGPERLLYGSGFPELNHGSTMLSIRHANIADAWSRLIAGGNLARLLEGAQLS